MPIFADNFSQRLARFPSDCVEARYPAIPLRSALADGATCRCVLRDRLFEMVGWRKIAVDLFQEASRQGAPVVRPRA